MSIINGSQFSGGVADPYSSNGGAVPDLQMENRKGNTQNGYGVDQAIGKGVRYGWDKWGPGATAASEAGETAATTAATTAGTETAATAVGATAATEAAAAGTTAATTAGTTAAVAGGTAGAVAGAETGAAAGSVVPGLGTLVGAGIGLVAGGLLAHQFAGGEEGSAYSWKN